MLFNLFWYLLICLLVYKLWFQLSNWFSDNENIKKLDPQKFAKSEILYKRILEASARLNDEDILFLSRQLEQTDNDIAIFTAKQLSLKTDTKAIELMFSHIEKLEEDILQRQKQRKFESLDFYEKIINDNNLRPAKVRENVTDFLPDILKENGLEILNKYTKFPLNRENLKVTIENMLLVNEEPLNVLYYGLITLKEFSKTPRIMVIDKHIRSRESLLKIASIDLVGLFKLEQFIPRLEIELFNFNSNIVIEAIYALVALQSFSSYKKIKLITNHKDYLVRDAANWGYNILTKPNN